MRFRTFATILVVLATALAACAKQPAVTETPAPTPTPQPTATSQPTATPQPTTAPRPAAQAVSPDQITGIQWQWTELTETEPAAQSVVADPQNYTLALNEDGTFNAKADCNLLGGSWTLEGDNLTLEPGPMTMAMCPPESLSDQYVRLLGSVETVALENDRLVLGLAENAGRMVFDPAGTTAAATADAPADSDIVGVTWQWERFSDQSGANDIIVDDPSQYTLLLNPDGSYGVKADCNVGHGPYTLTGSSITFGPGAMTRAMCPPESLSDKYLALLGDVVTYVMHEGKLVLNLKMDAGNMIFAREGGAQGGSGLDPSKISIDTQGLPYSWQANLVPATPYDASQPPGPRGLPEHIQINFGVTDPKDKKPGDPVIYIVPVAAYRQLWEQSQDPGVSITIDMLLEMIRDRPNPFPTAGVPVLPFEEIAGTNDLAAQGTYPDFGELGGLRFVGRHAQSPNAVTNEGLRYVFQGFLGDASEYLVAFFYPVSTSALPNDASQVPAAEQQRAETDIQAYLEERAQALNALSEADWDPNLATLDAVLASLRYQDKGASGGESAGIVGVTWQWVRFLSNDGTTLEVNDPENYTLTLHPDGTYEVEADCNRVRGTYTLQGSSLSFGPGASTLAECGPDSLYDTYLRNLGDVVTYVLEGTTLHLNLKMDAGNMVFTSLYARG